MTDALCPLEHRRDPERPRRAASPSRLCHGHTEAVGRDLRELATLHETLAAHLVSAGGGDSRSRDNDTGINLDDAVVKARDHIRALLVSWARIGLEEGPWSHAPADDPYSIVTWMLVRIEWFTAQEWADEMAANAAETRREAASLIQPNTVYRVELGPCPELVGEDQAHCAGTVIAVMRRATAREQLPSVVLCTEHGDDEEDPHAWSALQWHALGRKMGRQMHESAAQAFLRAVFGGAAS